MHSKCGSGRTPRNPVSPACRSRVNCFCPGFVDAEPPIPGRVDYVKALAPALALARPASASEIADAYLYLFGNAYATGSVIVVDGGATC